MKRFIQTTGTKWNMTLMGTVFSSGERRKLITTRERERMVKESEKILYPIV